jgi:poly(3-hydroxybutyrate) depolymerase
LVEQAVTDRAKTPTPPAVPAKQTMTSGDHDFTIKVGDFERRYTVHVPPGYDGKTLLPAVIISHSEETNPNGVAKPAGVAIRNPFRIVLFSGSVTQGSLRQPWASLQNPLGIRPCAKTN